MNSSIKTGWRKYLNIIIAIILLLIVTLSIIFVSYHHTRLANETTNQINLASRLTTVTQDIKNESFNIDIYAKELALSQYNKDTPNANQTAQLLQNISIRSEKLKQSVKSFSEILGILEQGAHTGSLEETGKLSDPENHKILHTIDDIWQPYYRLINNFENSLQENKLNTDAINYATDYARIFNDRLSALSEKITENLSAQSRKHSQRARIILVAGFIIAILIATYLIFIAFRQLIISDRALARSQRELNDIMDTISEGLFLVDKNLQIGEQHSKELERILHVQDIAHHSLTDILRNKVDAKDLDLTEGFLEQLFRKHIYDDLIESLNPLSRVHIITDTDNLGIHEDKYLSFTFKRVFEGKEINHILVGVRDITENVLLEQKLEQQRIESEAKMEMLSFILQVDDDLMHDFLEHVNEGCNNVNEILKTSDSRLSTLKNKLKQISRIIHGIKGEASALGLSEFTGKIEQFENDIADINKKSNITGNDFLGLTVHLDELITIYEKTNQLFNKLHSGKLNADDLVDKSEKQSVGLSNLLSRFASEIAERNGDKQVEVECIDLNDKNLNREQMGNIREMSLQLLRNAIVHGIETTDSRIRQGKPATGKISVQLAHGESGHEWIYSFRDDGAGINYDALRKLAEKHPRYKDRDPDTLTQKELIYLMFDSGTSTANNVNEDAGRGVGMDVIKTAIIKLHGKLNIHSESGAFTQFTVRFPVEEHK